MKPIIKKFFLYGTSTFIILSLLGVLTIYGMYLYLNPKLPDIETLKDVRLQVPLRVYTQDQELINEFGKMKRSPLTYEEFPQTLIDAILAAEDDRFFEHPGVDYQGILRAAFELIKSGGDIKSGGSTITMQVARNFFLTREKTYLRKLNEIFLALKIEDELTKQDILALYLNKIFLGNRAYGFAAAAQVYYGKPLSELTIAQTAMLAGLPKAPSRYNPVANQERATERKNYVLKRMYDLEYISEEDFMLARGEKDVAELHDQNIEVDAMYIAEMVRSEMLERYGPEALSAGFTVYTTINKDKQDAANNALRTALLEYDRRHGYRGHLNHVELDKNDEIDDVDVWQQALIEFDEVGNLEPAIVFAIDYDVDKESDKQSAAYAYTKSGNVAYLPWERIEWARRYIDDNHQGPELKSIREILKPGDVIYVTPGDKGCSWLAQIPNVSGALISLNPVNGSIDSLVGGFDFNRSKFNRVTQAKRQPGSSFKPFIYSAAIDKGFTPASIINDAPVVFDAPGLEDTWRPENYTGKIYGETRLRKALIKSRNLVSIRLLRDIGIGYAVRYARRFGFENANLPRDLSLALGSGTLTPLELATGYSIFANGGYRIQPYVIDYIVGPDGTVVHMTERPEVCVECMKDEEQDASNADEPNAEGTEAAADQDALTETAEAEQEPAIVPVQQDTLQAFLVGDDQQPTLEDTIRRELQFLEGPIDITPAQRILSPQTSFIMNSMLRDVIVRGTGVRARSLGRKDLAGKTGTTNDQRDAWFSGFNNNVVTIAWVGFDNPKPLGNRETGAKAALPMWISYMGATLKGTEETQLIHPPGIVSVRVNEKTGQLTTATDPDAIFEYLLEDQIAGDERPLEKNNGGQNTDITQDIF